jgi:hypothetical protein
VCDTCAGVFVCARRFAQFFISPLISADGVEREVKAVDSEVGGESRGAAVWVMVALNTRGCCSHSAWATNDLQACTQACGLAGGCHAVWGLAATAAHKILKCPYLKLEHAAAAVAAAWQEPEC